MHPGRFCACWHGAGCINVVHRLARWRYAIPLKDKVTPLAGPVILRVNACMLSVTLFCCVRDKACQRSGTTEGVSVLQSLLYCFVTDAVLQALGPEAFIPLTLLAPQGGCAMLCGDPRCCFQPQLFLFVNCHCLPGNHHCAVAKVLQLSTFKILMLWMRLPVLCRGSPNLAYREQASMSCLPFKYCSLCVC